LFHIASTRAEEPSPRYERYRSQRLAAILGVYFGGRLPDDALREVAEFSARGLITTGVLARDML